MMGLIVYIYYPLLAVLLFYGAKLKKKSEWNEEFLSLKQTKALQGFCAIAIMLHHIGQKTCAPWLKAKYVVHGLDVFVPIGYWFVAIFFFCSGYGLYKSFCDRPDYLKGFFKRRLYPVLMAFVTTSIIFLVVGHFMGSSLYFAPLFSMSGPILPNTYSWYIVTLVLLYLFFYFTFRYCKNRKIAIIIVCVLVLSYMWYCDWAMYGTWWYNTVPLFPIGILVAEKEKSIIQAIRKRYLLSLIITVVLLGVSFLLSENAKEFYGLFSNIYSYELCRITILLSQIVAAICFTFLAFLIGMKVQIGNAALAFMGTITLEFYLIHGLFVQLFGYCYLDESMKPLIYIKNVALMVLVVLVAGVVSAVILKYFHKFLNNFLFVKRDLLNMYIKDIRRILLVLIGIAVLIIVISSIQSHKVTKRMSQTVNDYEEKHIVYADVDGKKMAAYCEGEGKHTIVILAAQFDACPSIAMKALADDFAEENKTIVFDYFGRGFSDDTDSERTAEQVVYEIHEALMNLGEEGPFIIVSHEMAGLYGQLYALTYPEEVEAMIMLDNCVAGQFDAMLKLYGEEAEAEQKVLRKEENIRSAGQKLMIATGFSRMEWPVVDTMLSDSITEKEKEVLQEVFLQRMFSKNTLNEITNNYPNGKLLMNIKYPENIPVQQLLTYSSCNGSEYAGIEWEEMHSELITNPEIHESAVMNGNVYAVYYNPHMFYKKIKPFIHKLDGEDFHQ